MSTLSRITSALRANWLRLPYAGPGRLSIDQVARQAVLKGTLDQLAPRQLAAVNVALRGSPLRAKAVLAAADRVATLSGLQAWRANAMRHHMAQSRVLLAQGRRAQARAALKKARLARGYLSALTGDLAVLGESLKG